MIRSSRRRWARRRNRDPCLRPQGAKLREEKNRGSRPLADPRLGTAAGILPGWGNARIAGAPETPAEPTAAAARDAPAKESDANSVQRGGAPKRPSLGLLSRQTPTRSAPARPAWRGNWPLPGTAGNPPIAAAGLRSRPTQSGAGAFHPTRGEARFGIACRRSQSLGQRSGDILPRRPIRQTQYFASGAAIPQGVRNQGPVFVTKFLYPAATARTRPRTANEPPSAGNRCRVLKPDRRR
jgi:hypothetical protein